MGLQPPVGGLWMSAPKERAPPPYCATPLQPLESGSFHPSFAFQPDAHER
jgi:hypothetical protein